MPRNLVSAFLAVLLVFPPGLGAAVMEITFQPQQGPGAVQVLTTEPYPKGTVEIFQVEPIRLDSPLNFTHIAFSDFGYPAAAQPQLIGYSQASRMPVEFQPTDAIASWVMPPGEHAFSVHSNQDLGSPADAGGRFLTRETVQELGQVQTLQMDALQESLGGTGEAAESAVDKIYESRTFAPGETIPAAAPAEAAKTGLRSLREAERYSDYVFMLLNKGNARAAVTGSGWTGPRLEVYPLDMPKDSLGNRVRYGFIYTHEDPDRSGGIKGRYARLGIDDVQTLKLLDQKNVEALQRELIARAAANNEELSGILANLDALRREFGDPEDLAILARILASPYARYIDLRELTVRRGGRAEPLLTRERLALYKGAVPRPAAAEGQAKGSQTVLQKLLTLIAGAVRHGMGGWDRIAEDYHKYAEQLSAFTIKVAGFFQLFALAADPSHAGKVLGELKRWGFFGSPGLRALAKTGMDLGDKHFYNFDYSEKMQEQMDAFRVGAKIPDGHYTPVTANILAAPLALREGSLDVAETGLMEIIPDPAARLRLLLEFNRLLDKGGYLQLTLKHGDLPEAFAQVLWELGFTVLPVEALGYPPQTLQRMTGGDPQRMERVKSHLAQGSVLIAVKNEGVVESDLQDREEIFKKLTPAPAQSTGEGSGQPRSDPEEVDLSGLDYGGILKDILDKAPQPLPAARLPAVPRDESLEAVVADFEMLLPLLKLGKEHERIVDAIDRWRRPGASALGAQEVGLLRAGHKRHIAQSLASYTVGQIDGAFRARNPRFDFAKQVQTTAEAIRREDHSWREGSVRGTGMRAAVSSGRPLSLAVVRTYLQMHRLYVTGVPTREAERSYQREYSPLKGQGPAQALLRDHLLTLASLGADFWREHNEDFRAKYNDQRPVDAAEAGRYLKMLENPRALWTRLQLTRIERSFQSAASPKPSDPR